MKSTGWAPSAVTGVHFGIESSAWFASEYGRELLAAGGVV